METCRGRLGSHADGGGRDRRGVARGPAGRGAPGRGAGPATTQDPPGDADADPGRPQQTVGVPAAQAQGAAATGYSVLAPWPTDWNHVCLLTGLHNNQFDDVTCFQVQLRMSSISIVSQNEDILNSNRLKLTLSARPQ